jgi:hypothetical protein
MMLSAVSNIRKYLESDHISWAFFGSEICNQPKKIFPHIIVWRQNYCYCYGRTTSHKFYINNTPIENCRNYVYLGVTFSTSGSFTEAKNNLYHKGLKALFKVKKCFQGHSPKIKTIFHIFDYTIKPILLYGSEIWGSFPAQKLLTQGIITFLKFAGTL